MLRLRNSIQALERYFWDDEEGRRQVAASLELLYERVKPMQGFKAWSETAMHRMCLEMSPDLVAGDLEPGETFEEPMEYREYSGPGIPTHVSERARRVFVCSTCRRLRSPRGKPACRVSGFYLDSLMNVKNPLAETSGSPECCWLRKENDV